MSYKLQNDSSNEKKNRNRHKGHRKRLRERFLKTDLSGFCDHEILELLLFYSLFCTDTNEIAHDLIERFGNIYGVLNADVEALKEVDGVKDKTAIFLKVIHDCCIYYPAVRERSLKFTSVDDENLYFSEYFKKIEEEMCVIFRVNLQLEIMDEIRFPLSSLPDGNEANRFIAHLICQNNFDRVIIAHNRMDSRCLPASDDYKLIKSISETLKALNIKICDYLVCISDMAFSMYRNGAFDFDW